MLPLTPRGPLRSPAALIALSALTLSLSLTGCRSYTPKPLDLSAHANEFSTRAADAPSIRAFADQLARQEAAPTTFNLADGLSIHEAEVIALFSNADLRTLRTRSAAAEAYINAAGTWEDPVFSLDLARIIEETQTPWKSAASVGLSIPFSGRLHLEKLWAKAEHAATIAEVLQAEWNTRIELRRAWIHWSSLAAQVELGTQSLAELDAVLRIVDVQERAHAIAAVEANVFRIERASLALELSELQTQSRLARARLHRLMGLPPDTTLSLAPWGTTPSTPLPSAADVQARFLTDHPTTAAITAQYQSAERMLAWEIRKQYPDLQMSPGFGNDETVRSIGLGISLSLPIFDGNSRGIAQATAHRDTLHASAHAAIEQLIADLSDAQVSLDASRARLQSLDSNLIPLIEQQARMLQQLRNLGESSTLITIESLTRERQARRQLIEAREQNALAEVALLALAGPQHMSNRGTNP